MIDRPRAPHLDDEDEDERDEKTADKDAPQTPQIGKLLFESRTILIFGEINMKLAKEITAQLVALDAASNDPIKVVVNSPGGHVESGDTIHDMLRFVSSPIRMIGTGWVASAGALIYLAGDKDNRFCLPNTRFLLHQPMGGVRGPAVDIDIEAQEIIKMRARINEIIARETGQDFAKVEKDTDRNYWLSPDEAKAYGLVTRVIESASEIA